MLCFYGLSWYLKYTLDFSPLNGISPLCIISWRQKGLQGIWIRREQCQVARNFQAASIARLQNVFMWNKSIYKGSHCSVKENYFKSCFFKKCSGLFPVRKRKKHWKFQILIGWGFFLCFFFFFLCTGMKLYNIKNVLNKKIFKIWTQGQWRKKCH